MPGTIHPTMIDHPWLNTSPPTVHELVRTRRESTHRCWALTQQVSTLLGRMLFFCDPLGKERITGSVHERCALVHHAHLRYAPPTARAVDVVASLNAGGVAPVSFGAGDLAAEGGCGRRSTRSPRRDYSCSGEAGSQRVRRNQPVSSGP